MKRPRSRMSKLHKEQELHQSKLDAALEPLDAKKQ